MSVDPALIHAIRTAVEAQPDNGELRLHLAELLIRAERHLEALHEARIVLANTPAHLPAINMAALAAERSGMEGPAAGYRKLSEALGWTQAQKLVSDLETATEFVPDPPDGPDEDAPFRPERFEAFDLDEAERREKLLAAGSPDPVEPDVETSDITLKDVAGMEAVKRRLDLAFLGPLRNPELRRMFKKSLKGGLLLYGPPGCGKTHIARALAGELTARFISVSITDVLDMYIGESEKNLSEIFKSARRLAPVVLFFDELDALGRKRSLMRDQGGRSTINQLLEEMDGLGSDNEGIYVLAATNHPWDVDSALRRPGRFDRTVLVTPPDQPARESILRMALEGRPVDRLDLGAVAKSTEDFSGADMVHLVDSASEFAMEDSLKRGKARPIQQNDFKQALKEVKPSIKQWLETARKYAVYSNEGGQWDELRDYLKSRRLV